ncbi:hypothetical protein PZA11_006809 [Diplocarpon coronariae]
MYAGGPGPSNHESRANSIFLWFEHELPGNHSDGGMRDRAYQAGLPNRGVGRARLCPFLLPALSRHLTLASFAYLSVIRSIYFSSSSFSCHRGDIVVLRIAPFCSEADGNMGPQQKPPQSVEARNATTQNPATLIFGHGYGADADGFITRPHPSPSSPSALPPPHPASLPPDTEDSDESESESEIWDSVDYIDAEVSRGVPAHRIVAGGLSQDCAVSLVLGRAARYRGQLGGRRGGLERVFAHGATGVERARGVEKGERAARGDGEGVLGAWDEGYDGSGEDV